MRLLIIEDNPHIVANLYGFLEPLGYTLDIARNGPAGIQYATQHHYEAIVLDLSLPGLDGLEVCRQLRQTYRLAMPILMLTARDTVQNKLSGFEAGADDYLVKPYSLHELEARLKALVRRARNEQVDTLISFGELRLDTSTGQIWRAGQLLTVTPTGRKIILTLLREAPKLVTREALEKAVWNDNPPDSDALRTHIHTLRQVLDKPFAYPMLKTIAGMGYRLVPNPSKAVDNNEI